MSENSTNNQNPQQVLQTEPAPETAGAPKQSSALGKIIRFILWTAAILYIIAGCAWLAARYLLGPYIEENKANIENKVSEAISTPLTFGELNAGFNGLSPQITIKDIQLGSEGQDAIHADSLTAKLSLSSVPQMKPIFESVVLENPTVTIEREGPMKFSLLGRTINLESLLKGDTDLSKTGDKIPSDVLLLLKQKLLEIKNGTVKFVDKKSGREILIKDITAAFENKGGEKLFAFTITPPAEIASPISVRAKLIPPSFSSQKLGDWNADLYAQTDFIDFGELASWLPDFSIKYRGVGSGSIWASFEKWKPVSASFIGALSDVNLTFPGQKPLEVKYVKGKITGTAGEKDYSVSTEDFSFELTDGTKLPPVNLSVRLDRTDKGGFSGGAVKIDSVQFSAITALLPSLPLPDSLKEFIMARRLDGSLEAVDVSWQGEPDHPKGYAGTAKIRNFTSYGATGNNHTQWLPGFRNISASLVMKNGGGTATLDTHNAQVALPGLFPSAAFLLDSLTGTVEWSTDKALSLNFKDVLIENADASVTVSGTYQQDETPFGTVNLEAKLNRGNVPAVWKYMPLIVGQDTITWLRYGLLEGKATGGSAHLVGALHNFPFQASANEKFDVRVDVDDVLIDVYPNKLDNPRAAAKRGAIWPLFSKVGGVVEFIGDGMYITADRGSYKDASLIKAKVDIPSFSADTVWLKVDAQAKGNLPSFIDYVKTSPVNGYTGGLFTKAAGKGDGTLQLGLNIPLDGPGKVGVKGAFTLADDSIRFNNFQIPDLTKVSGTVNFSESGADAEGLKATCYGENVTASIRTAKNSDIEVKASGTISAAALPQVIPVESLAALAKDYLTGSAPFTVTVTVGQKNTTVDIQSSLKGLESKLPAPMTKAASMTAPLHIVVKDAQNLTDVLVNIDQFLSTEVILKNGEVVQAAIGNKSLPTLPPHGYAIAFDTPTLSAKSWESVLDKLPKDKDGGSAQEQVTLPDIYSARIDIGEVLIDNFNQTNLSIVGKTVDNSILGSVRSNQMLAQLEYRKGSKGVEPEILAHISKLFIPSSTATLAENTKPIDVKGGWPAINAVVDDLTYGKMHLGKVELIAKNTIAAKGHLWQIKKLNVTNPAARLRSSGSWLKGFDGTNETRLLLDNHISNLGGLLNRLDFKNIVRNGSGTIKGDLSWEGTPLGFNTESFDGHLTIALSRGEILKIQPGPAAKLLSLLTLQSLTRYLTLDFRDFYSSGFNFTTIRGDASIDNGLMTLKDLTMVGGSATVVTNGTINTRNETENLHLLVLPDINAAGASVALAIANPIAGIGSFLAQLIFKDPLSKLFSFEYDVTGTWSDPIVKKVDRKL